MSQVNLLAHALHSLMAIIGIARMVVGVAAVLEQAPTVVTQVNLDITNTYNGS